MNLNKIITTILLWVCLSCSSSSYDQTQNQQDDELVPLLNLSDTSFFIEQVIDGALVSREVIIEAPNNIDASIDYPIVIAFHGRNVLNDTWINKLNHLTSVGEFVGVYPQGYNKMWNSGGNESSNADDISFVDSIMVRLKNYKNLDHNKRFAIGTSNGSSFTNKLVIETSYFNATSTIVGQLPKQYSPTNQTKSTSIYQVNGAADTTCPIDGGPKLGYVFLEALESAQTWANAFECDSYQLENIGDDKLYVFKNCKDGKEVRYLRIEDGQHNLHWGAGANQLFSEIWEFLKRF